MIKILTAIILFSLIVFVILYSWKIANIKKRKKIAIVIGSMLILAFIFTTYLVIN